MVQCNLFKIWVRLYILLPWFPVAFKLYADSLAWPTKALLHLAPAQLSDILSLTIFHSHYAHVTLTFLFLRYINFFPPHVLILANLCLVNWVPPYHGGLCLHLLFGGAFFDHLTKNSPLGPLEDIIDYFNHFALIAICSFLVYYFIVYLPCMKGCVS